ncbi:MAG: hypothetical protein JSR09_02040 [Bacteroidetes bacterium]|nr:hypothetical protein [Bacteroidota bacterium]MBS1648463.1 hypothetical protein [Bacteroidota bacterium]
MKLTTTCILSAAIIFSACSSNTKRITILGKGKVNVDTKTKTITIQNGAGTIEQTTDFNANGPLSIKLNVDGKESTINISENGLYILNAKNDTVVGSYQKYAEAKSNYDVIKQDMLKHAIDSLNLLIQNKNVSVANRNFYIEPFNAVKVTNNIDATVVTPYHRMTSIEQVGDKEPEVYRFWSIKEIRDEMIPKLAKDTVSIKK